MKKYKLEILISIISITVFLAHYLVSSNTNQEYLISTPLTVIACITTIFALLYVKRQIVQFKTSTAISHLLEAVSIIQRTIENEKKVLRHKEVLEKEDLTEPDIYMLNAILDTSSDQLEALIKISQNISLASIALSNQEKKTMYLLNKYYYSYKIFIESISWMENSNNKPTTTACIKLAYRAIANTSEKLRKQLDDKSGAAVTSLAESIIMAQLSKLKL